MELSHFVAVANCLEQVRRDLPAAFAEVQTEDVPKYPQTVGRMMASGSTFEVHLFLSRRCCAVETTIAVYDLDDDKAPMLIASDEEINELCRDCIDTLREFGIELNDLETP